MSLILEFFKRIFSRWHSEEYSAMGSRLKQIEHDPHRHQYNYDVLDNGHFAKTSIRHNRRAEHHSREFLKDPRAEHPVELLEDRQLPVHQSAHSDHTAAHDHMIRDFAQDQLYNYTAKLPIIHDDQPGD